MADILWSSNAPWSTSGYGNQTAIFVPRFAEAGHRMAISCFYGLEGGRLNWNGITCYPTDFSRFGAHLLGEYASDFAGGDRTAPLVLTLQDLWPLTQGLKNLEGLRFACWTPVDHDPCPPQVAQFIEATQAQVVAMSRHGQKALQDCGFDPSYVPHAVDTSIFFPQRDKRSELRATVGVPEDAFVVGMVANNSGLPARKSYPQVFEAFAAFHKKHNDAILYVHSEVLGHNNGTNLVRLSEACGIPGEAVRTSNQLQLHLGIPQPAVAGIFGALDVLCMPSMGEGFGIPLIEAQACGVPVITTDWTAMTELCGAGWLVEGEKWWDERQASFQKVPYVADILEALENAYNHAEGLSDQAVKFAADYDADKVMRAMWLPTLDTLLKPREIAPLKLAA